MPKPDTHVTLKCCHKINLCYLPTLTSPLWGCKIKRVFNSGSALYLLTEKVITLTEGITCWMSRLNFGVWIHNLGALPIIASVSLTHIPCLFACIYESVSCVYAFFPTCLSACVARAVCFVFCSIFLTTFLFSFFFFYKFNRHLCHGAYWCTHNPAHMPRFLFHLHLHFSISCVCVSKHVYAFPSSSIFIHTYRHIPMYICFDYSVMTPYKLYALIMKRLCVPAPAMSPDVYTLVNPCSSVCISLIIRVYASCECTYTMFISKKWNSVCNVSWWKTSFLVSIPST